MPNLSIYLLGAPRIEIEGVPIQVDTRKAIALVAYLTVTGEEATRDSLAALLWPEYDQTHARAALRRTLSVLNKSLEGFIKTDRDALDLACREECWVDVHAFRQQLEIIRQHRHPRGETCAECLKALHEAVNLYRDHFMAGFSLRDSLAFDEWQFFQAESLRRDLSDVLERLAEMHSRPGEWEQAIQAARRWISLDPLHEEAHRRVMELYTRAGERGAALRQYRELSRVLDQELGVPPLDETTELYEFIRANRLPASPDWQTGPAARVLVPEGLETLAATSRPARAAPPSLPLVGRTFQLEQMQQVYDRINSGGMLIALEGEAGIGKTRLAEEFLAAVRHSGGRVLAARCYQGEQSLAYNPLVEVLRDALHLEENAARLRAVPDEWLAEAARLLPEVTGLKDGLPPASHLSEPGAQNRFLEGLSQIVQRLLTSQKPGVLFVDDVHWCDPATLDLLTFLVRRLDGRSLCLLLAWRSDEAFTAERLNPLLAEARRAGRAALITLERLNQAEVDLLLQAAGPEAGAIPPELRARMFEESEGLPFFVVEYLAARQAQPSGGQEGYESGWDLPGGARDLLLSRLARVSAAGSQTLTTAAVIGRSFDFDILREASGRSEEEVVTSLEELLESGLIREVAGVEGKPRALRFDFAHDKLRSLVYEQTSHVRRRLLHRRVAEALAGRGYPSPGQRAGQVAFHYESAGQEDLAGEFHKKAGEQAAVLYANVEAIEHYHKALAFGHPQAAEIHEALGDLYTLQGEYPAGITSYETAAALSGEERLARLEHKLGKVFHRQGDWGRAEERYQAALEALQTHPDSELPARIYADWSLSAHHSGRPEQARELAHQALQFASAASDLPALAQVHNLLGILARYRGDLVSASNHLKSSLHLGQKLADRSAQVAALNNLALVYSASGLHRQALKTGEKALQMCVAQGDRHREAALHNNLADLHHANGEAEEAMQHLKQAVTIFAEIGEQAGALQPEIWKLSEW